MAFRLFTVGYYLFILSLFAFSMPSAHARDLVVDVGSPADVDSAVQSLVVQTETGGHALVLLAEDHRDSVSRSFYKSLIEQVRNDTGKRICYFLELSTPYQDALDALIQEDPGISCFEKFRRAIEMDFHNVFGREPRLWLNIIQLTQLKKAGVKLVSVDRQPSRAELLRIKSLLHATSESEKKEFDQLTLQDRNIFMANTLNDKFKEMKCQIGFFSVGSRHMFPSESEKIHGVQSIDNLLTGFNALKINGSSMEKNIQMNADVNIYLKN